MRIANYRFSASWLTTFLTLCLGAAFAGLGQWQLHRAAEKRALIDEFMVRSQARPVELDLANEDLDAMNFLRVRVVGSFEARKQFLLDNQVRNGRVGYSVLTPLRLANGQGVVVVDRGWVPQGQTRDQLPKLDVPRHELQITGTVYVPSGIPLQLGSMDEGEYRWPRTIQYFDFAALSARIGYAVRPLVVRLDPGWPFGYERDWQPVALTPERHVAYAVQWFALAVALVIIFLIVNIKRIETE